MERENPFKKSRLDDFEMGRFSDQQIDIEDLWWEMEEETNVLPVTVCNVQFLNIDAETVVYKYQSRVRKEAKQRLKNANAEIMVTSSHQIEKINAWIQREPKAVELFGYDVGRVPFTSRDIVHKGERYLENERISEYMYSIDLDSIYYDGPDTKRPVYKLAKTDMLNRNRFQLVIQLVFVDHSVSQDFVSPAFYCCTQPKQILKRKPRSTQDIQHVQYPKDGCDLELHRYNPVVKLLQADKAMIDHLEVRSHFIGPKKKADIAYHFGVEDSEFQKSLEEGDVVGLTGKSRNGVAISKLTSANFHQVLQAGVISRSAFFEGNTPIDNETFDCWNQSENNLLLINITMAETKTNFKTVIKSENVADFGTDKICMLGIINVKVIGPVKTGERVYASLQFPGKAVAESHPMRTLGKDRLLGIATETFSEVNIEKERLVRCFVSFLFGITSKYLIEKTDELRGQTKQQIEKLIDERCKCLWWTFVIFILLSLLLILLFCFILNLMP